jgi:hypothetical protein
LAGRSASQVSKPEAFPANHFVAIARFDVPYQSLLKVFLAERLERERRRA